MKTLSEGDLLAILKRYDTTRSPERQHTNDILAAMKEACNKMVDVIASECDGSKNMEFIDKESILNLKIK